MSAVTSTTTLLVPESGYCDVAVVWVVARGTCVIVATDTAMGVAVGLVVLIPVGSTRVPISVVGTAIAAILVVAVAATVGTAESSFKKRHSCLNSRKCREGLG